MSEMRLQKFIADCGVTSRRKAEELIVQGRVTVNGNTVRELGTKVSSAQDVVMVDGRIIDLNSVKPIYLLLYKPRGYVTTISDPEGRRTVMDLCKEIQERIYPVGRLDYLSEGLLILTNDGEVANMVMHPSFNVVKVYEVKVFGAINDILLKKLRAGARVDGDFIKPLSVRVIRQLPGKTWLEFRLGEGKNREIRKLCEAFDITVDKLKRVAIGGLSVDGLAPGNYRFLSKKELVGALKRNDAYFSCKKTINLKKKGHQNATLAGDPIFKKFKREDYFTTVKNIKENPKNENEIRRPQEDERYRRFRKRF